MPDAERSLFDLGTWLPALDKFGAVTHLTVSIYAGGRVVCGPVHATPLVELFARHGYDPGLLADCARQCLAQGPGRPAVVTAPRYGLAVVGTSLVLDGDIVGAAVAGYALVDFVRSSAVEQLARAAGVPFRQLWDITRTHQPIPERRLLLQGELLQVLGDAILREHERTRRSETTAAQLAEESSAKDDFLATLSHELRTPLTPILAWARMLKAGNDPARVRRGADVIERNAVLQARLVDDLLELNRATRGKATVHLKVQDLNEVLRSSLDSIAADVEEKGLVLDALELGEPLMADIDGDRVEQILRNVLSNAVKFTPRGGRISVRVAREHGIADIRIRDSGVGIAPEFVSAVFDPFRQQEQGTRRQHPGMGIGLALVKQLTELHGGEVRIASEGAGRGTEVTVRLPITADGGTFAPPPRATDTRDLSGIRLLLVEDEQDTREAIQMMLEDLGAEVEIAGEGLTALEMVGRGFDPVLCDLRMPEVDGFEFIKALRARLDDPPPVIAMSGLAGSADHARTVAAGFYDHVNKPLDMQRLVDTIKTATANAARQQRLGQLEG